MTNTLRLLVVMLTTWTLLTPGISAQTAPQLFQQALAKEQAEGKLQEAIQLYQRVVNDAAADRTLKARALLQIGRCHEKLGNNEARKAYDQIVRQFADQADAAWQARTRLASMTAPSAPAALSHAAGPVSRPVNLPLGVPSPDGQYFAYNDDGELVIRVLATGEDRKIVRKTATEEAEYDIVWTRDSKRLVFDWWKKSPNPDGQYDLRIVNVDGSGMRILVPASSDYITPLDCSPDGTLVAIASIFMSPSKTETSIRVVPLAGGKGRVLKTLSAATTAMNAPRPDKAAFSADGRYLAYSLTPRPAGAKSDIFRLPLDGSGETTIVQHPADDRLLGWTPDGRAMLFSSDRSGTVDIWLARIEDGRAHGLPERIKKDVGGRLRPMGFVATGTFFYRVGHRPLGTGGSNTDVFVATIDPASGRVASPPAPIAQSHVGTNAHPRWSPDGRHLAYKARTDPAKPPDIIAIMSLDTGEEKYVRPQNFTMRGAISWHPDGRSFLVDGASHGAGPGSAPPSEAPKEVFSVDIATANVTRLFTRPTEQPVTEAEWIDNGRSILFVSSQRALIVRNIETGTEVTLYDAGDGFALTSPAISPDGQQIAFRVWEGFRRDGKERKRAFMVIPRAGGQPRELAPHHDYQGMWGQIAWAPDGRHLYFCDVTGDTQALELWRIPSAGGKPQKVGISTPGNMLILGIHPDGKRIAFMGPYGQLGTWVLENFLPKK